MKFKIEMHNMNETIDVKNGKAQRRFMFLLLLFTRFNNKQVK